MPLWAEAETRPTAVRDYRWAAGRARAAGAEGMMEIDGTLYYQATTTNVGTGGYAKS